MGKGKEKIPAAIWETCKPLILEKLEGGRTVIGIAADLGVEPYDILNRMKKWGVQATRFKRCTIDPALVGQIKEWVDDYVTVKEAARRLGCGVDKVRSFCRFHSIPLGHRREPRFTDEQIQEIIRLHREEGWTQKQIGDLHGVPQPFISKLMRKAGVRLANRPNPRRV